MNSFTDSCLSRAREHADRWVTRHAAGPVLLKIVFVLFVAVLTVMHVVDGMSDHSHPLLLIGGSLALTVVASLVIYFWGIRSFVRSREADRRAMQASEERWKFALEGAGAGVWEFHATTGEAYYSRRCKEILGFADDEIPSLPVEWHKRTHADDLPAVRAHWQDYLSGQAAEYRVEFRLRAKDGKWRWILDRGLAVSRDADGRPLRVVGTHTDITEQKGTEAELRSMATTDALTGLSNRRHFMVRVQDAWSLSKRLETEPVSVLLMDIDRFKQVNDSHGHAAGDAVLRHCAGTISASLRRTDSAGRLGGEEFALVLLGADLESAREFAERIRLRIAQSPLVVGASSLAVTVSIGVSAFTDDDTSPLDALNRADIAMYAAKQAGRNRVHVDAVATRAVARTAGAAGRSFVRLTWRQAYACGHEATDRQHRSLFESANRLLNMIAGASRREEAMPLLREVLAEIVEHFSDEEELLRSLDYGALDEHIRLHRSLSSKARQLAERYFAGEGSAGEVFGFIAYDVVARHILSEDRKFFDRVRAQAANVDGAC